MKYALITDQHFGCRGDHLGFLDYQETFYNNIFFPYIDKHNIKNIIDLGDTFDRRKYVNYYTLNQVKRFWFDEIQKRKINLTIILGNHTTYFKNTNEIHSLSMFQDKFRVISEPCEEGEFLWLPWINSSNEKTAIELIEKSNARFAFGHLQLKGFEMHVGSFADDGLDSALLSKFEGVYSGHFHHKSTRNNVHYLGAPYEITWSDYSDLRGFHIFDSETGELEFIQNPYSMFHKVIYNDSNTSLEKLMELDFSKFTKRYVKIILLKKENPYWFEKFFDEIEKANPFDLQVVEDHLNLGIEEDPEMIEKAQDTFTILKTYVNNMSGQVDKPRLEKLLKELYDEAHLIEA